MYREAGILPIGAYFSNQGHPIQSGAGAYFSNQGHPIQSAVGEDSGGGSTLMQLAVLGLIGFAVWELFLKDVDFAGGFNKVTTSSQEKKEAVTALRAADRKALDAADKYGFSSDQAQAARKKYYEAEGRAYDAGYSKHEIHAFLEQEG